MKKADAERLKSAGFDRRQALASLGAFSFAALSPSLASSARGGALHLEIADRVRVLAEPGASLAILIPNGSGANVDPVIEKFRELTGIQVRTQSVAVDEINVQLAFDGLSGAANYDLALPATFGIPDLADGGVILPLTEFSKRHEPDGFRDSILYTTGDTFDGDIYGFQTDGDTYVMFYHKEWLEDETEQIRYEDRFGQALSIPRTWEELDQQMAFFHRPDDGQFGGALFRTPGYLAWEWWVRFHAKGVWPFSAELEPQIASDAGVSALEDMIRATEHLYPQARSAGLFENWENYGTGNTFANIGWGGSQKYLNGPKSNMRGKMVYGLTPCGKLGGQYVNMPYFNWGWNYVITSASRNPELAYLFALFASTSEISTLSVREQEGYFDPFRPEHYDDPVIRETYTPEFLKVHRESLRQSIPDLYLAQHGEYFQVLNKWLDAAINGVSKPKEALENVSRQWSLLNLRVGKDAQKKRWNALRSKYPSSAQSTLRDLA